MSTIDTRLTTSGNSIAVRLPKELLRMSGFNSTSRVRLDAVRGKIIISKSTNPREGWSTKIKSLMKSEGDPTLEFNDMNDTSNDELGSLPWDGPSFEQWQSTHDKLS